MMTISNKQWNAIDVFAVNRECQRCKSIIRRRYIRNPREYPFCPNHTCCWNQTCNHRKDYLRCHGNRKDGSRCRLVFNMIIEENDRLFLNKEYCFMHMPMLRKSYWIIGLMDRSVRGVFTSLEKAEDFAEDLQRTHNKLIEAHLDTNFKEEYYLTEDLSLLKIICLIDLINEFIGKDRIWIVDKPLTVVDFDCDNETKHSVKVNEPFSLQF